MAAHVRQRDREIAIRLALGATTARIRRFVLTETVRLTGVGALVGIAGAIAAGPLLRGLLFGVGPLGPVTIVGAALLLVGAALLASSVPLRRATRVDAVAILRRDAPLPRGGPAGPGAAPRRYRGAQRRALVGKDGAGRRARGAAGSGGNLY